MRYCCKTVPFKTLFAVSMMLGIGFTTKPATSQTRNNWQFGINLTAAATAKANIRGNAKTLYGLESKPQPLFEAGVTVYRALPHNWWFNFGLGGGVAAWNFDYYIPANSFSPPLTDELFNNGAASRQMDLFYVKLPVELEKRWVAKRGNQWNAAVGASILMAPPSDYGSGSVVWHQNDWYTYKGVEHDNNNGGAPWLNFHVAGGYSWQLRSGHLIRANAKASYSPTEFGLGSYQFLIPGKPVETGEFGVTGSYLGISLSYIFAQKPIF